MIERYSLPRMAQIWSEEHKLELWLKVELLACEALAKLGAIPPKDLKNILEKSKFDIKRMLEIEAETQHDVIAFLSSVAEKVGPSARFMHLGMTSSDVLDTALSAQMVEAADILIEDAEALRGAVKKLARQHKKTVMIGRSHGIHAEPTTFGLKMALFYDELDRSLARLREAREIVRVGKISGAVGTHANIDPRVEEYVCGKLGLKPAKISTQILQRDRHADYMSELALVASTLEKYAEEIRNLQKTEVLEVEEPFAKGQKGSSAMPHKRNPIVCERICGMARVIRGHMLAAYENVALWHERDISHSSAERIILPDSAILLDYMLVKMKFVVEGLQVYPERMRRNLELTRGLIFSQRVLLELTKKGVERDKAYRMVQRNAMDVWRNEKPFRETLLDDKDLVKALGRETIMACFDLKYHLKDVDRTFKVLGLE